MERAAELLGFSRQHVLGLIEIGELAGAQATESGGWMIPLDAVLDFERRRSRAGARSNAFSRTLDRLGAPAE